MGDAKQLDAERRALELRLSTIRADLANKDDTLLELEFSLDNIVYQDQRRSGTEKHLREEIEEVEAGIRRRIDMEQQSMHDILRRIAD